MSDASAAFLALLARAFEEPERRPAFRRELGVGSSRLSFQARQDLIGQFLEDTVAAHAEDVRSRLHVMLVDLRWRPSMMPERVLRALGLAQLRDRLLADLVDAFPVAPLEGDVIREAYLDDELAFREVPAEEYARAREQAVTMSWRDVPDDEIEFAFSKNSVYSFLDTYSIAWYLPAILSYALREHGQCEFYTLLYLARRTPQEWPPAQRRAIGGVIAYIVDDDPDRSVIEENQANIDAWIAASR